MKELSDFENSGRIFIEKNKIQKNLDIKDNSLNYSDTSLKKKEIKILNSLKNNRDNTINSNSTKKDINNNQLTFRVLINSFSAKKEIIDIKNPLNHDNKTLNNQELEILNDNNYFQCFICENYFLYDFISKQIKCNHFFCRNCGKLFYEEKIEQGQFNNFKCGIKNCNYMISDSIIENLVSKIHYQILLKKKNELLNLNNSEIKQNSNSNSDNLILNKIVDYNSNLRNIFVTNKFQNIINYSLKNVFDINSNETFYQYTKNKNQICPNCKEMELYGKSNKSFIKCLNCFHKFCKYCFKNFDTNHLEKDNINRCKIYYRRKKDNENQKMNFFPIFLLNILMLIGAYFIISTYFFVKLKKIIQFKKFSFIFIIKIIIYLFLSIIFTPLSILIIPYFSIITCI